MYEILNPVHITTPIAVTDRATGANTDPLHLAKRQAVGALSFESLAIRPNGTMIYGDELAPSNGIAGGGIYKFVPAIPFAAGAPIAVPAMSPLVSGSIYAAALPEGSGTVSLPLTFSTRGREPFHVFDTES